MAWSKEDLSYWKHTTNTNDNDTSRVFAKYKNTGSRTEYLCSMQAYLGVASNGTKYTAGSSVTGTGAAVNVRAKCGSSTATVKVEETVGRSSSSSGYYPKYSDCETLYTFYFSKPIAVSSGSTVSISLVVDSTEPTTVMVCKNENPAGRAVSSYAHINIDGNDSASSWKKAIAWVNIDGTDAGWRPANIHICTNATSGSVNWEECRSS